MNKTILVVAIVLFALLFVQVDSQKAKKVRGPKVAKPKKGGKPRERIGDLLKDFVGNFEGKKGNTLEVLPLGLKKKFKQLKKITFLGKKKTSKRTRRARKCPNLCGCKRNYEPVCGASGRTHRNECLAKCHKDQVTKKGHCEPRCVASKDVVLKRSCRFAPFGKNGVRQICCKYQYNKKTKKASNHKCQWVGAVSKTIKKFVCVWKKRNGKGKQRFCCSFTRTITGRKFKDSKKSCKYIGHVISSKKINGCSWKQFGKYGRRKYCCTELQTCLSKKCKTHTRTCSYKGPIYVSRLSEKCAWQQKNSHCRQVRCCEKRDRCIIKAKGNRKCQTKNGKCRWVGKKFCRKAKTVCQWRRVGKNGRRRRCCRFHVVGGKKVNVKCKWTGCVAKRKVQASCKLVQKKKGVKQTQCCRWTESCKCGKCSTYGKRCRFVGKPVVTRSKHQCFFTQVGKNGKRRRCCKITKKCQGKKCHAKKTCSFVGLKITTSAFTKCAWKKLSPSQRQRVCCTYLRQCTGKKCLQKKRSCRRLGAVLLIKQKGCSFKKHGTYGKRKYCCKWNRQCKGKICKNLKKQCKFVGLVIRNIPKKSCGRAPYGGNNKFRTRCCKWNNYCEGKKCTPTQKRCSWHGPVRETKISSSCKWVKRGNGKQKKCCRTQVKCLDSTCRVVRRKCSFIGKLLVKLPMKDCYYKPYGQYSRRKYCCRKTKVCKGDSCKLRKGKCGWIGSVYKRQPITKCSWVQKKKFSRRRCCSWIKSCISGRCQESKKRCKFIGHKLFKFSKNQCKWRIFNKVYRRRQCCKKTVIKPKGKKGVSKINCVWKGKSIKLSKSFHKKQRVCSKTQCCFRLSKCTRKGKQVSCQVLQNVGCVAKTKSFPSKCTIWGSGHVKPFVTRTFTYFRSGDLAFLRGKQLKCHARVVQRKQYVQVRGFACKVKGDKVESIGRRGNKFLINGKSTITMKKGKVYKLPKGGYIKQLSKNTVVVDSNNGAFVEANFNSRFVSIISKVKHASLFKGLCQGKNGNHYGRGIFKKQYKPKNSKFIPVECKNRKQFVKECKKAIGKRRFSKHFVAACVDDRCRGLPLDVEKHMLRETKFVKKLAIKSCKWRSVPKKKGCKGYYCCSSKKSGRGKSKSKCHFVRVKCPKKGKKVRVSNNIKCTGIIRHVQTRTCGIQTKYTVKGAVGVLTGVAVQCKGNKFVVSSATGSLKSRLNGRKLKGRKVAVKGLDIKRTHRNAFVVTTKGFKVKVIFNRHTKSFVLQTKVTSKKWKGFKLNRICKRNAVKKSKNSWFKKFIAFVKLSGKKQKKFSKKAKKACKNATLKKSCKKAVASTGSKKQAKDFAKKNKGSNKAIVRQQKKAAAEALKKQVKEVRAHFCRSNGDPHFSTFSGKAFDNYQRGDFVLVESSKFKVHARQAAWGAVSVNDKIAVQTNKKGGLVVVNSLNDIVVDGIQVTLPVNAVKEVQFGGSVKRYSNNGYKITAKSGSYVDVRVNVQPFPGAWPRSHYIDVIVFAQNVEKISGFCQNKDQVIVAKGLFSQYQAPRTLPKPKPFTPGQKDKATQECRKAGVQEKHLKNCVTDVLRSGGFLNVKNFRKFELVFKKDQKRFAKVCKKHVQGDKPRRR